MCHGAMWKGFEVRLQYPETFQNIKSREAQISDISDALAEPRLGGWTSPPFWFDKVRDFDGLGILTDRRADNCALLAPHARLIVATRNDIIGEDVKGKIIQA